MIINRYGDDAVPFDWKTNGVVPIFAFTDFGCSGSELSLLSCPNKKNSAGVECTSETVVGLRCPGKLRGKVHF